MQLIRILLDIVNMSTEIKVSPVVGVSPRVPAVTHIQDCVCVCVCVSVCLCVCLSAGACLEYCTDPDVTWGSGQLLELPFILVITN